MGDDQKFCSKCGFPNLVNGKTSKFMFPKYLIEYQNIKIVKSKSKMEKCKMNKHKSNTFLKENEKKDIKIEMAFT